MKSSIPVGRMLQRNISNPLETGLLLLFPPGLLCSMLSGIPQLPGGEACFAREAGQAEVRMISKELLIQLEELSQT